MLKFKFLGLLCAGFFLLSSPVTGAEAASVGVAVSVYGEVWVLTGSVKEGLKKGDLLHPYQTIITGKYGRVSLLMNDKSKVYLSPKSRLRLQKYEVEQGNLISGAFNMFWGKARYFVNKLRQTNSEFRVHSRTAVLGVRGTIFEVSILQPDGMDPTDPNLELSQIPPTAMTIDMISGVVELTNAKGKSFTLKKGSRTSVSANGEVTLGSMSDNDAGPSESNGENQESHIDSNQAQQTANQLANTVGAGTSAVQGSTITTPYKYNFGGR